MLVFSESISDPNGPQYFYGYYNDIPGFEVGSIVRRGGRTWGVPNVPFVVHTQLTDYMPSADPYWQVQVVGDVLFTSSAPTPLPGSDPEQFATVQGLNGAGRIRIQGGWHFYLNGFTGDVVVESDGAASIVGSLNAPASPIKSLRVNGLVDLAEHFRLADGVVADLTQGVLDLGRLDNTAALNSAGRLILDGSLALGDWVIAGRQANSVNDRIDVTGALDLTQSHVLPQPTVRVWSANHEYLVLAKYGNRIGSLDVSNVRIELDSGYGVPYPLVGNFPIIYTSAENAGPGEIRVVLPEPSIFVTVAISALLVRRRREQ